MDYLFYLAALGLFGFVVYWDAYFLQEKNPGLYDQVIKISPLQLGLLSAGLILLIIPIYFYLYLRRRYVAELNQPQLENPHLLSDALGVAIRWVAGIILVSLTIRAVNFFNPDFNERLAGLLLSTILSLGLVLFFIMQTVKTYSKISFKKMIAWQNPNNSKLAAFSIAIFLGAVFAFLSAWLIFNRADNPMTPLSEVLYSNESMTALLLFYLVAIFVAPALEEIIFRGYFFTAVSAQKGDRFAFWVIGFVFAFLHVHQYWGDWLAIVFVTGLGYVLTQLRVWSQSVWPSVIMHTIYNCLVSILPVLILMQTNPSYVQFVNQYEKLNFSQREELLKKSIQSNPQFAEGYNSLAWIYAEEGKNLNEALVIIDKALTFDPDSDKFLDTKAEILFRMGRAEEAIEIEKSLVKKFPKINFYKRQLEKFEGK